MFEMEFTISLGLPALVFTVWIVATELDDDNSVVRLSRLIDQVSGRWSNAQVQNTKDKDRLTISKATMMVWKVITEYLMDSKQSHRVRCTRVRCCPNQHTYIDFISTPDLGDTSV